MAQAHIQRAYMEFEEARRKLQEISVQQQKLQKHQATVLAQLHENETVQAEFNLIKDDTEVYKMIGPTLVKQDAVEAKSNIDKRINYFKKEQSRIEQSNKDYEKQKEELQKKALGIQKWLSENQENIRKLQQ
ncbi:prefoldin subunit 6 [Acrasis kona]|uniref:Prefoldin subunit 6 n=1 Tax=Acrasis kona TaxID=1008807 RepID=A0AAW2YZP4_9EUKA